MDQPFLLMTRDLEHVPIPDEALATMNVTRQQMERLDVTLYAARDAALERTGGGSYVIRLENNRTSHMDFSDLPFLGARDS